MHGRGACVVVVGGMHDGGHVWRGACMVTGMHGEGCAWWGACMVGARMAGGGCAWQILRDTVNERAVRILLKCILVMTMFINVNFAEVNNEHPNI